MQIDRRLIRNFDWVLLGFAVLIPCLSFIVLYSAGYDPDGKVPLFPGLVGVLPSPTLVKQIMFLLLGLVAMTISLSIPPQMLHRVAYVLYGILVLMLMVVLVIGTVQNGSRRWLSFGGFNLQPAEPMKLVLILTMSRYIARYPPKPGGYSFTQLIIPALLIGVPMALVMKQPDLGTALAIGGVGFLMLMFVGIERRCLIWLAVVVAAAAYPAWINLHDYQQKRVLMLFNPETDPRGSGYHIIQSIIAVGSGAFAGKGFLKGTQTQLEFLPEHSTDFIFSVLAEEWGFIGCIVVLMVYLGFLYRLLRVVQRTRDTFTGMVVVGITSLIFIHTFVNIGMVIGILPVVGIPLIMFSYGGSSLISTMFSLGVVLGISMRRLLYISKP